MTTTPPSGDGADAERTLGLATAGTTPSARRGRTVRETSAGGLVVDDLDGRRGVPMAAIIGRAGRRGRVRWSLPKGHIEIGETPEQAAVREVGEETGLRAQLLAPLGRLDFWFSAGDDRVRKTVHHYLLHFLGGELCAVDHEVDLVAWVPLTELHSRLAYPDERRLAVVAEAMADTVREHGVTALPALPRHAPRRRPQSHSRAHL